MILVDTSVWINHLRHGEALLTRALLAMEVGIHPFVVGEIACGNLKNRQEILQLLQGLPPMQKALDSEVMHFIEHKNLMGRGIGYVDAHLCASALLSGARLWTRDKRLLATAQALNLAWHEPVH